MFKIEKIKIGNKDFELTRSSDQKLNTFTVLVGPNGVGKSRVLATLAMQFTNRLKKKSYEWMAPEFQTFKDSIPIPKRVVAQTFSPFSRFPRERQKRESLNEYLWEEDENNYSVIGFTKNWGVRGSVSKDAIGRIVRKLYSNPSHVKPLRDAMVTLGFTPEIHLGYSQAMNGSGIGFNENFDTLTKQIKAYLGKLQNKTSFNALEGRLILELQKQSAEEVSLMIYQAIDIVRSINKNRSEFSPVNQYGNKASKYFLSINLINNEINKKDLQAVITLTRLGLIRLVDCYIQTSVFDDISNQKSNKIGWSTESYNLSNFINLVDASSGEQQLLSSLFGIAAEVEDASLVLIDEPELSLHPAWQTKFISLVGKVIESFNGCHVFIATHSALLAQSAIDSGIQVVSLDKQQQPQENSSLEGSISLEQTLLDVFGTPTADSTYISRLILSYVIRVENNPESKELVLGKLYELKENLSNLLNPDDKLLGIVTDALDIVHHKSNLADDD